MGSSDLSEHLFDHLSFRRRPPWWYVLLAAYAFLTMTWASSLVVGDPALRVKYLTQLGFLLALEIVNQISYRIAGRDYWKAVAFKGTLFWFLYTAAIVAYVLVNPASRWSVPDVPHILVFLMGAMVLPFMSLEPRIRFLFLYGEFKSWKRKKPGEES